MQNEKPITPIMDRVNELYTEIRQIYQQYLKEVPKKRRPWPESIKARILELWRLGVSSHQISLETGLPTQTMYSWRQKLKKSDSGFLPVPIVKKRHRRSNFDIQLSQLEAEVKNPTVTVITPDGFRIEGVPTSEVAIIMRGMAGL